MNAWTSVFTAAGVNDFLIDHLLSQLKKPGPADGSDMIRHSELTVNQNA